jgi:hypothetical protein
VNRKKYNVSGRLNVARAGCERVSLFGVEKLRKGGGGQYVII